MTIKDLRNFFDTQLKNWELARYNYSRLRDVRQKLFNLGSFKGVVQYNPARAVSTMAKVDKASVAARKCFLCEEHRAPQQESIEILAGWDLLVNPYPILPFHFTIAGKNHTPQKLLIDTGLKLAESMSGMVVFYNSDGAGASAPDHIHFQAVEKENLPLISLLEDVAQGLKEEKDMPFHIMRASSEIKEFNGPVNAYFYVSRDGESCFAAIPRRCHRPEEYYKPVPYRRTVSPGALDMAGIIVVPVEEDFLAINNEDIHNIYRQVAFCNE